MAKIVLTTKDVLLQNVPILIEIGEIDDNQFLTNITSQYGSSLTISVVSGRAKFTKSEGNLYLISGLSGSLVLLIRSQNIVNYVSLWTLPQQYYPQTIDLTSLFYKYLPPNCYSDLPTSATYAKAFASASVLSDVYNSPSFPSINTFLNLIFPPYTSDSRWEQMLNTGPSWAGSYDYALVIQTVANVFLQNTNVYDSELTISKYIYARTGGTYFVYIESGPTVNVYINTLDLSGAFLQELELFITKLFEPQVIFTLTQTDDFSQFGLFIYIGDTYPLDPRLYTSFALRYSRHAVYNAQALCSPYNPIYITGYYIYPEFAQQSPGTTLTMAAILVYTYNNVNYYKDVTEESTFVSNEPSYVFITSGHIANFQDYGEAMITATYLNAPYKTQTAYAFYTTTDTGWVVGVSHLGTETELL